MPYVPMTVYTNNPSTTVSSGGTSAPGGGTAETWTVASSASFPTGIGGTQFHVADPALPSEVITVVNVAGATWTVTRGAEGSTPVAHTAGFAVVQVVSAGDLTAMQYQPWQFPVEAYGAVCDGQVIADVVLNSTTTMTSATAGFTAADTGKRIMINGGAGTTSPPLVTTITYVNATTVTLASAASVTGSAYVAIYGTDDTAAINSAVSAAKTFALANGYFAEVLFGAKYHILASGPTQTTTPAVYNAQIPVPYPDLTGAGRKLVIILTGPGDGAYTDFWESTTPNVAGCGLVSMTTAPQTPSVTYGNQSVIGGPTGGGAFTGGFANTKIIVRGLTVICGAYTNQNAFDFSYLAAMRADRSSAHVFAPTGVNGGNEPTQQTIFPTAAFTSCIGTGLVSPTALNNAEIIADDIVVQGFTNSFWVADHFTGSRIQGMYCNWLLTIDPIRGTNVQFPVTIQHLDAEAYLGCIRVLGGGAGNIPVYINFASEYSGASAGVSELSDPGNTLHGEIHWAYPTGSFAPQVSGAQNVRFINDSLAPGQWTGAMTPAVPAVPATTVAQVNTARRDAAVYLTSGGAAVTVIKVDAVTTGLTLGTSGTVMVRVPSGHSITLTYASTAPTWVWVLE